MRIIETLLFALALIKESYLHKGVKNLEREVERFALVPERFVARYQQLIRTPNEFELQRLLIEFVRGVEATWQARFRSGKIGPAISDLRGFYEEFKSTYNKMLWACDVENYDQAYPAAYMIDRETKAFLAEFCEPGYFPFLMTAVLGSDFAVVRNICLEHERQLLWFLQLNEIVINEYSSHEVFKRYFLESTR